MHVCLRAVAIDQEFARPGQKFCQGTFFLGDTPQVTEKLQVFTPNAGDDAVARLDHSHQGREFARMIGAGLKNRRLMAGFEVQQSKRHADVIVETGETP